MSGPPKEVSPSASQGARANQQVSEDTTTAANDSRSERHNQFDVLAGNGQRLAAKRHLEPLGRCGCLRDPLTDRHRCDGEVSDHMAYAAVAAVKHLERLGTPALFNERTCRAMSRIGHHALAETVRRRTTDAA